MTTTAIILAAGRGSRMDALTDDRPKCLLQLAGKPLLDWQVGALRKGGMDNIYAVLGYRSEVVPGDFRRLHNPRWSETNMVRTLMCAEAVLLENDCIISYSDIAYHPEHIAKLAHNQEDIAISYDTEWAKLWGLRFDDPLSDAETFRQQDGLLQEIGKRTDDMNNIHGQYMGLIKCTPDGYRAINEYVGSLSSEEGDKLDMTSLLSGLLAKGVRIGTTAVCGRWVEADNADDLKKYEAALQNEGFSHDFRW